MFSEQCRCVYLPSTQWNPWSAELQCEVEVSVYREAPQTVFGLCLLCWLWSTSRKPGALQSPDKQLSLFFSHLSPHEDAHSLICVGFFK